MSAYTRISKAFEQPLCLPLEKNSRYVLVSDCHRGCGGGNDNFLKNEHLYVAALTYYGQKGFTCLELGDGDELWENRSMAQIKEAHRQSFEMIAGYYKEHRYYALFGNHDMVKQKPGFGKKHYSRYGCCRDFGEDPLCPGIRFYSGMILQDQEGGRDIYLLHGHQADVLNSTFWKAARFLVRHVWKHLEKVGIKDPTSAAKNYTKGKKSEEVLTRWAKEKGVLLIAGHTHRPRTGTKESPYFNTGSCVHPGGITVIEIREGRILLVKWSLGIREDLTLYVVREELSENLCLELS